VDTELVISQQAASRQKDKCCMINFAIVASVFEYFFHHHLQNSSGYNSTS
jgi:hypothetical protein